MDRAVRLLAAKPRSIGELRERLLEKLWTDTEIVEAVILKLEEYGYLDDKKYARDLAMSKLRQRPQGARRLKQSLVQRRLDRDTIDSAITQAFDQMPEDELIERAIEKQVALRGRPRTHDELRKIREHLMRRGFSFDLIRDKTSGLIDPGNENMTDP